MPRRPRSDGAASILKPVRLHTLPPALGVIVFVTAIPIEIGMGTLRTSWPPPGDFIANVLLFMPLGAALSRHRSWVVVALAFALSCTVELIQNWSIDRFVSPFDLLANTGGGLAGAVLWTRLGKSGKNAAQLVTLGRAAQIALAVLCATVATLWFRAGVSSAIVGWDPSYALLIGDERTGNRSWEGVIEGFALVPEAVDRAAARRLSSIAPERWRDVIPRATLLETNRYTFPQNTSLNLPPEAARDFADGAAAANAFTLVARVKPASLEQTGPARILSFSWDPYHRNVDLGQQAERVMFRVRTPISGDNGGRVFALSGAVLQDRAMTLVASYDGAVSRVYVDGRLSARANLAAAGCHARAICDGGAHMAWTIIGATAVILATAMLRVLSPSVLWGVALGIGALLGALVVSLADDHRIVPAAWTAVLPLAGALTIAMAIHLAMKTASVSSLSTAPEN